MEHSMPAIQLPVAVVSPIDVGRLLRELEALDEFLRQVAVRKTGEPMSLPRTSKLLEDIARDNNLNLLNEAERQHLLKFMRDLKTNAPVLHISFAADPSSVFLRKLMEWLRREIHPQLLVRIGLQPSIAAGCIVRSPDKYFDFSLRQHFLEKRGLLIERIGALKES